MDAEQLDLGLTTMSSEAGDAQEVVLSHEQTFNGGYFEHALNNRVGNLAPPWDENALMLWAEPKESMGLTLDMVARCLGKTPLPQRIVREVEGYAENPTIEAYNQVSQDITQIHGNRQDRKRGRR